tara:strand:+ start:5831 stop:6610 length:780 start_codon:yes stop_codon:yes gene_type:complete
VKKILVTGAKGQLGSTLKEKARSSKDHWVFCGRDEFDITDSKAIAVFLNNKHFDYCINCAAYTNVVKAEQEADQAQAINFEAVKKLVHACNQNQITLIHISTDYVFDGNKKTPYLESDATDPLNQYGKSKLLGEQEIQKNARAFYIIRTSWLYSKTLGSNFYSAILNKSKKGEALFIVNDQIGTPTNVDHLAAFVMRLILKEPPKGLYHFSDEQIMSWFDLAVKILEEHQLDNPVTPIATAESGVIRPYYSPIFSNKKF